MVKVRRKVKLAQIVCAVYSLNKPAGATKREIVRFCKRRYGITCSSKELDRVLERGLDEGLLTSFCKRYQVTKLRSGILWIGDRGRQQKKTRRGKGSKSKKTKVLLKSNHNKKRRPKNFLRKKSTHKKHNGKQTSSLYRLWKKELKRQLYRMKQVTKRRKNLCKKRKSSKSNSKSSLRRSKRRSLKQNSRAHRHSKNRKITDSKRRTMKNTLISNRASKNRIKRIINGRKLGKKANGWQNSGKGVDANMREFHRLLLRQTKQAVVHGKSWDSLNFTRNRRIRENNELVKKSQLVQKILTQKHAASWDDLNSKLKHMKEVPSWRSEHGRAKGVNVSRQNLESR